MQPKELLCREVSFIEFNKRVLAQAEDINTPLLERLKFICIVSSNLDEFFEVRVAALKRLNKLNPNIPLLNGQTPIQVLQNVREKARELINQQYTLLNNKIIPELKEKKICFLRRHDWTTEQSAWIKNYFDQQIKPIITPIGLDPAHPFPKLLNKSLNFIIQLEGTDAFGRPTDLAIVQAPRILPRVVKLPQELSADKDVFIFLSSIIHNHIQDIFIGMKIKGFYQFRVTRDSELILDDDDLQDLLVAVQGELHERQYGRAVRLEVATNCPPNLVHYLTKLFLLQEDEVFKVEGPVNLNRLMSIPNLIDKPELKYKPKIANLPIEFKTEKSIFEVIRQKDMLLHHPYQSFQPVVDFIQQSAKDPQVVSIKMTIYRTGSDSDIIKALIIAALAGKEVTVVVELMARFDEEANVYWANKLEDAGAHVVYGVVGYKVHAKMLLVVRKENKDLKRYAHVGTGNYHQGTSKLYTDFGLLTCDSEITSDISDIFMQITGLSHAEKLRKLYQSPFTLHPMLIAAIDNEIKNAKQQLPAKIIAKMNSLVEPQLINKLYEASQAGVEIDLIVRGICVLNPQVPNLSENIHVRSIIGRLLEHSRVFYFYNNGTENTYISSADWMIRNMFGRVEICTPILDPKLKARVIDEGLKLPLADNQRAWVMQKDGDYQRVAFDSDTDEPISLQDILFERNNC